MAPPIKNGAWVARAPALDPLDVDSLDPLEVELAPEVSVTDPEPEDSASVEELGEVSVLESVALAEPVTEL